MDLKNLKNQDLDGVWELLGATLRQKISQKLSWLILVNLGWARIDQNLAQNSFASTIGKVLRQ